MPELARGAAKAVYELYDVVTHELLSSDLRYLIGQMMQKIIGMMTFFKICKLFLFFISPGSSLIHGTFWREQEMKDDFFLV